MPKTHRLMHENGMNKFSHMPFTNLLNVTGQPSISLPLMMSSTVLPIGMQFAGRFADEATLLQLAAQLEQALPWKDRKPSMYTWNILENQLK